MNGTIVNVPSDAKRAKLDRALAALNVNPKDFIIHEKTLRLEKELASGRNTYKFNLYENPGADRPQEVKLNRSDLLIITHAALCIAQQDKTAGNYGNYPLHTFPDPGVFVGDDGSASTEDVALETVYNGQLSITTNNLDRLQGFLTNHFRYVPERAVDSGVPAMYGPQLDGRGFYAFEPHIIVSGQDNNDAEVQIGEGDTTVIGGGIDASDESVDTSNVLVLMFHGFIISEGAAVMPRNVKY